MPLYNSNSRLQSPTSLSALLQISIFSLLLPIPSVNPISFNFPSSDRFSSDIITMGNASISNEGIELTANHVNGSLENSVGRAIYKDPMHLWDKATGRLTDFTTHFSFIITPLDIKSSDINSSGDGLAFFLTANGSSIPPNTMGGSLGLLSSDPAINSAGNPIVFVEFDSFTNSWDPPGDHIGINFNSIVSRVNMTCPIIKDGRIANAWVSYNSCTQNLSIFLTYTNNTVFSGICNLTYLVDLREFLPEWVTIGFSAATESSVVLHQILSWEFNSSLNMDNSSKTSKIGLVVALIVGGAALIGGLGLVWYFFWKKNDRGEEDDDVVFGVSMDEDFEKGTGAKRFLYGELARATNNFEEEHKLGEGGFGGVYRGVLSDLNLDVAVKRISRGSKQGIKEYKSEVKIISRLRHRNLVQLVGWCHQRRELLLVYEFMPNGSLDSHLFKEKSLLAWEVRYKIAHGLASALLYLHEEWEKCVVHRDIKSSNVMLDSNFNAKLGDFGLAKLIDHGQGSQTTVLAGTWGYMAPEYVTTRKANKESDVYSFGVVALEIACGRSSVEPKAEPNKERLVEWVWELYGRGEHLEAADVRLDMVYDEKQIERLMVVGLWCAHPDYNLRPSVRQAMHVLSFESPLPILPSKMPVPTYFAPPLDSGRLALSSAAASSTSSVLYPR